MSSVAAAPDRAGRAAVSPPISGSRSPRLTHDWLVGLLVAVALVALAFLTTSGSSETVSAGNTWSEIALVGLAALGGAAVVVAGRRGPAWGAPALGWFAAFTAFAGLSIAWSVRPDWSWFGADQLAAYLAAFTLALAAARLFPERWPGLIGGLAAASALLCAWSLLAKVFPATLAPANAYGRLLAPFGYWNAIGVVAALGIVPATWAAARPEGGRIGRILCAPALTLMLSVAILSLSRSALLTGALALAVWFVFVPLRLRSLPILLVGGLGTIPLVLIALGDTDLSGNNIALSAQDQAGHHFGLVLVVILVLVTATGAAVAVAMERVAPGPVLRRRIGTLLVALVACLPVLGIVALAASHRGLFGQISHAWTSLTSTKEAVGNTSQRLTQLGSSRPLYWHQGLQVGGGALLKGVGELGYGIARLHVTTVPAKSDNAHSYVIQTFADLGLIGIVLTLGLLVAWARAALRALAWGRPWPEQTPEHRAERAGLVALAAVVVAFGIQSSLDWTWYFPGVAVPALFAAGWLAGRGPLDESIGRRPGPLTLRARPLVPGALLGIVAVALAVAWVQWQPLRSAQQLTDSETAATASQALSDARASASSDPLATYPQYEIAVLLQNAGQLRAARSALRHAVAIAPSDPRPWGWLATFDLQTGHDRAADREATRVLELDRTADVMTFAADDVIARAGAALAAQRAAAQSTPAQRRARARSRRRHSGGPAARTT